MRSGRSKNANAGNPTVMQITIIKAEIDQYCREAVIRMGTKGFGMRCLPSVLSVALISSLGLAVVGANAQDGQACLAIIKKGNDLNGQISAVRKKADDEEECNAEAKLWAQAAVLLDQRIALEKQKTSVCAGFTVTGGVSLDELVNRADRVRKFEAKARESCDPLPPPTPPAAQKDAGTGLIVSGTITCFGGGDCKSQSKPASPANGGPTKPIPKGTTSTLTGKQFGDKEPATTGPGTVTTAK